MEHSGGCTTEFSISSRESTTGSGIRIRTMRKARSASSKDGKTSVMFKVEELLFIINYNPFKACAIFFFGHLQNEIDWFCR